MSLDVGRFHDTDLDRFRGNTSMQFGGFRARAVVSLSALCLQGCFGLTVPEMQPLQNYHVEGVNEEVLAAHVKCELHFALQSVLDQAERTKPRPDLSWLSNWGAQINLKVAVDEKSNLSPGIVFNSPLPTATSYFSGGSTVSSPQSFAASLGGSLSADATRTETIGFYYLFSDLLKEGRIKKEQCRSFQDSGLFLESDLKIQEFMENKILLAESPFLLSVNPAAKDRSPFNVFTYETAFVVSVAGNVTPTWKLVRVTANPTGPFVGASRMRTDDLTITMGGTEKDPESKKRVPSSIARDEVLATLIGQNVATQIATQQR